MVLNADIQNSANWEQVWATSKRAAASPFPGRFFPLEEIPVPVYLSSPLLAVLADSTEAPLNWYSAGWLQKMVSLGITVGNAQNTKFEYSRRVPLRQPLLVQFPSLGGENYKLIFQPHKWIQEISFYVWEYKGDLRDSGAEQLDATRIDVLRLEKKVDIILQQSL